jgi:hypothetical protein
MRNVENSTGRSCTPQFQEGDHPTAIRTDPDEVLDVELGLAEECICAGVGEVDQRSENHTGGGLGQPTELVEVCLAVIRREVLDDCPEILEIQQRQPGLICVVEDQSE